MAGLRGHANLWRCRHCRHGTSTLTITRPAAFAHGVNLELLTLDPFPDQPFTVTGILPPLPFIIDSGATASFEVRTERAAGLTPPEAFAPYFQLTSRCGS
jgi:hypothetical protein